LHEKKIHNGPLIVDNKVIDNIDKTSKAIQLLKTLHAYADVEKVKHTKKLRRGKGKMRNRRYVQRRGPLIVYNEKTTLTKAFRNLPGIELVAVSRLNLLQLAPGGHLGRFIIWTKDAFEKLDSLYGTYKKASQQKHDYRLPRPMLTNADVTRIINSDEIQSALRAKIPQQKIHTRKKNPLKNLGFMIKLNPHAKTLKRRDLLAKEKRDKKKSELLDSKRKGLKKDQKGPSKEKVLAKRVKKENVKYHALLQK